LAIAVVVQRVTFLRRLGLIGNAGEHTLLALHRALTTHAELSGLTRLSPAIALDSANAEHQVIEVVVARARRQILPAKVKGIFAGNTLPS
jgi:hypothetical protein